MAALSYVWILSVIVYFAKKDSPFVRFHARQGIVLFVLSIVCWFVPMVGRLLELIVLALAVIGFLGAAQGHWKELPVIYAVSQGDWKGARRGWQSVVQSIADLWHRMRKHPKAQDNAPAAPVASDIVPGAQSAQPDSTSTPSAQQP